MKELPKGSVVFKHLPQDFIVEEIWGNEICRISDTLESLKNHNTDIGKLTLVDRKPFLTCDLEKSDIDHFTALSILAKELHNLPHELGYAGTKDKVAWTCQRISIFNADIDRIKSFSFPGIVL
ncbi:MAG TPA: tRNA pseudouridine(13) synthase TruD, partial [Candidatus Nanoarchaeia archaeon]|nr:tRNA pseudouridine(13) synthase TruD [Candidatus Nanoarchaeia archaeon]